MKKFLGLFFLTSFANAAQVSPVIDPNKFTICTITINSVEEKNLFAAQAAKNPKKFNPVVELTDFGSEEDWFKNACSSNIRCDQLVVSGHFGGTFFGEKSTKKLSAKELEAVGCSKTCENILSKPYEVFLFGCNTLATKEKDNRTPAQYLQVLLNDNIPLREAELVVEARYGNVGDSNKSTMQRAFGGEKKQLYGFDSVGPSGKNVQGFLKKYFSRHSPANHLEKLQAKRMMETVNMHNQMLADNLKSTAFAQCGTGPIDDPVTKKICELQDSNIPAKRKLALSSELLGEENFLVYLPAISAFFKANPPSNYDEGMRRELQFITKNPVVKRQLLGLIEKTNTFGLKSEWSMLAENLGYLSKAQTEAIIVKETAKFFNAPLTLTQRDTLCSLEAVISQRAKLKLSDIKNRKFGPHDLKALGCLGTRDPGIIDHVGGIFASTNDPKLLHATMDYLFFQNISERLDLKPETLSKLKALMGGRDLEIKRSAFVALAVTSPSDPELHKSVEALIKSKDKFMFKDAIGYYGMIKGRDPIIHDEILKFIRTTKDKKEARKAIRSLMDCEAKAPQFIQELKKWLKDSSLSGLDREDVELYVRKNTF